MTKRLRALITGVGSGIGEAVYTKFKSSGYAVVGVDVKPSQDWLVADLSISSSRSQVVNTTLDKLGGIDVLINAAGIFRTTPFGESSPKDWHKIWDVNLEAPIELMSLVFEIMQSQNFGRVVNVTSVHSKVSKKDCLAYDVGKAGLEAATRSFALSGAQYGILANSVAPGFVRTQISVNADGVDEADTNQFKTDYITSGRLPLRRSSNANEIAESIFWLSGVDNTYVTGQVLIADGGLTATF